MYKKIKNLFVKNFHWKILSIFMATILWLIVMNINNPTEIKTFSLNIKFLNNQKLKNSNITILNIDEISKQKAEVKIRATRPVLDELTQKMRKDDINLSVDLGQLASHKIDNEPLNAVLPVQDHIQGIAYLNNSFDILSFSPRTIIFSLDNIITIPKKIHINVIGKAKDGYTPAPPEISSEYINVTGAKSIIENIEGIYVDVNISGKDDNVEQSVYPVAYDKAGNKVDNVSFNINKITVKVPINVQGQINIAQPKTIGSVKDGHFVKSINYIPKSIAVIGKSKDIQNIGDIRVPTINISRLNAPKTFTFDVSDILAKNNLLLKDSRQKNITVYVNVQSIDTNTFTIPTSQLKISGFSDDYDIEMPKDFSINIEGEESAINELDIEDISCSIHINDLKEGTHIIEINITLPNIDGISLANKSYISVTLSKKMESTESETESVEKLPENKKDAENIDVFKNKAKIDNETTNEATSKLQTVETTETSTETTSDEKNETTQTQ